MKSKTKVHKTYNYLLRGVIVVATWAFVYKQLFYDRSFDEIKAGLLPLFEHSWRWGWLAVMLGLMLLNWGLESLKWQQLISKIERLNFGRSFKAVLTGVSVSMFTPNRVGEYFGRVFMLKKGNPMKGILVTIVGSYSQLTTTLVMGLFGLLYFVPNFYSFQGEFKSWIYYCFVVTVPFIAFSLLILYFNVARLGAMVSSLIKNRWPKVNEYVDVFARFSKKELLMVLLLSLMRYMIFTAQFYIMLWLFSIQIPYLQGLLLISVIYFVITVIPTVALAELGIRGSVAVYIVGRYMNAYGMWQEGMDLSVFMASTLIWMVNLLLPAVLGTIFVFQLKFFRKYDHGD